MARESYLDAPFSSPFSGLRRTHRRACLSGSAPFVTLISISIRWEASLHA